MKSSSASRRESFDESLADLPGGPRHQNAFLFAHGGRESRIKKAGFPPELPLLRAALTRFRSDVVRGVVNEATMIPSSRRSKYRHITT